MYISSINAFTACWLLLYSIKPLYSEVKKSHIGSYEINTMYQSEPVLLEKQVQSNVSKLPQYIYHRNYQSNSVQSQLPSMDMHHEAYVKENVAKSMPEYQVRKKIQIIYHYLGTQYCKPRNSFKRKRFFVVGLSGDRKKERRDNAEDGSIGETVVRRY